MKSTKVIVATSLLLASFTATDAAAQEVTLELNAQVNDLTHYNALVPGSEQVATIRTTVTYDFTNQTPSATGNSLLNFQGQIIRFAHEFFDAQGESVDLGVPDSIEASDFLYNDLRFTGTNPESTNHYSLSNLWGGNAVIYQTFFTIDSSNLPGNGYASLDGIPRYLEFSDSAYAMTGRIYVSFTSNFMESDFLVTYTSLSYNLADADNDGVTDELDSCDASLLDETVWFDGWYDSGVTNYGDGSGCTVMDHYAACGADQEEQQVSRFSLRSSFFYSGPSYCEKQVAYGLVSDGLIDYSEARALRDALYYASRNNGNL
jgi:hypothetical protein